MFLAYDETDLIEGFRLALAGQIADWTAAENWTQKHTGELMKIRQPRVSDIVCGKDRYACGTACVEAVRGGLPLTSRTQIPTRDRLRARAT